MSSSPQLVQLTVPRKHLITITLPSSIINYKIGRMTFSSDRLVMVAVDSLRVWSSSWIRIARLTFVRHGNMSKLVNMFCFITAVRLHLSTGFSSQTSSFTRPRYGGFGRRYYSATSLRMGLQTAIVGMPNVGKVRCHLFAIYFVSLVLPHFLVVFVLQSTLFNALTESQGAEAANYPFCTIEPNNVRFQILSSLLPVVFKADLFCLVL
jgi:hypothetical protein